MNTESRFTELTKGLKDISVPLKKNIFGWKKYSITFPLTKESRKIKGFWKL